MARPVKLFYSCVLCIAGPSPRWQRMCLCSLLSGNFPQIQRYFCPSFLKSNSLSHLIMLDSSDHTIIILCVHMLLPIPFLFSLKTSPIRISSSPFHPNCSRQAQPQPLIDKSLCGRNWHLQGTYVNVVFRSIFWAPCYICQISSRSMGSRGAHTWPGTFPLWLHPHLFPQAPELEQ